MKWSKGQTEVVTAVLIFGVVISLVGATYIWGVPLIKKQQAFGNIQKTEQFMKDLETVIENIDKGQTGSKSLIQIKENGVLSVNTDENAIEFLTHEAGTYYILSDEVTTAWNPIAWGPSETGIFGKDAPAILRAKAIAIGDGYDITYQIKFRKLVTQTNDNIYIVRVETDTTRNQNTGVTGDQISIENLGRAVDGQTTYTRIKVTVPK